MASSSRPAAHWRQPGQAWPLAVRAAEKAVPCPHGQAGAAAEEQLRADRLVAKAQRKEREGGLREAKRQQRRLLRAGSGKLGWLLGKLLLQ